MKNRSFLKGIGYAIISSLFFLLTGCQKTSTPLTPTTSPMPGRATIVTAKVSGIQFDSAIAGGIVSLNGDLSRIDESGVCIDTLPDPNWNNLTFGHNVDSGAFQCVVGPLNSNQVYHVRAYIRQGSVVTYGQDVTFTSYNYPSPLGNFFFRGNIMSLTSDNSNNIYVGGSFYVGEVYGQWSSVGKFNGSSWAPSMGIQSNYSVPCLYTGPSGIVYAASENFNSGVEWDVSQLNGTNWSTVGVYNNGNFPAKAVCADNNGNVYTIGSYTNTNGKYYVAQWGPGGYNELGNFDDLPETICTDNTGKLYVGGLMNHGGGWSDFYIAVWDGTSWSEMGHFNDVISSICFDPKGNMIVAGAFNLDSSGNVQSFGRSVNAGLPYFVAKWDGHNWSALGNLGIIKNYGNFISNIYADPKGNIYAIGNFIDEGGQSPVLQWDGSSWKELATFNDHVLALCIDPAGHVYAGGKFQRRPGEYYVAKCK